MDVRKVALLLIGFLTLVPTQSWACSCVGWTSVQQLAERAQTIFTGRALGTRRLSAEEAVTTFEVITTYKGDPARMIEVYYSAYRGLCPMKIQKGDMLTLTVGRVGDGPYRTSHCGRVTAWIAPCELEQLRNPNATCSDRELQGYRILRGELPWGRLNGDEDH